MKKFATMAISIGLIGTMVAGGSLAYLQDQDEAVNVMTLGKVQIEQIEQERDTNGNLVDFTQAKPAYPAVGPIEWADDKVNVNGTGYKVFTADLKNVVDKIVTVKNTGKSDAYVRTVIAIEAPEGDPNDLIHFNYNDTGVAISNGFITEIDGVKYYVTAFTYNDALKPNDISAPSLMQLFLDSKATNEDCAKFGESWEVLVLSQAVQTAGFADAKTALDTAFGEITADNHPWSKTVFVDTNNEAELMDALTSGKNVIVNTDIVEFDDAAFNGNGTEVTLAGVGEGSYGYLAFAPGKGNDTKVENLAVTGSGFVEVGHWENGGGDYTVNNLVIKDLASTLANGDKGFTLACAFCHYGDAILNNCTMTGATAVTDGAIPIDAGFVNDTTTVINGGEYGTIYCWSHAVVTIDGAEVDTVYAAPIKGTLTIKAGTHIDTLNIAYGTSAASEARLAKLSIEDDATIGKIVFSDKNNTPITFNTVADWNAYVDNFDK